MEASPAKRRRVSGTPSPTPAHGVADFVYEHLEKREPWLWYHSRFQWPAPSARRFEQALYDNAAAKLPMPGRDGVLLLTANSGEPCAAFVMKHAPVAAANGYLQRLLLPRAAIIVQRWWRSRGPRVCMVQSDELHVHVHEDLEHHLLHDLSPGSAATPRAEVLFEEMRELYGEPRMFAPE